MMRMKEAMFWALLLAGTATGSVQISEHVKEERAEIAALRAQISAEKMRIEQLDAEWHQLTSPEHLTRMAAVAGVEMVPIVSHQYGDMAALPEAFEAGPHDFAGAIPLPPRSDGSMIAMEDITSPTADMDAPVIAFADMPVAPAPLAAAQADNGVAGYDSDAFEAMIGDALSENSFVASPTRPETAPTPFLVAGEPGVR